MPKPFKQWKVLPHGEIKEVDPSILTVTGEIPMPFASFQRRMTVVRLRDSRLVIFSAIALDDAGMRRLEAFGRPASLIVPSDKHRLDARIWKDRYPTLQVITPEGARAGVEKIVAVDATDPRFDDPNVQWVTVAGTRRREAALVVNAPSGTTLVLNDVVGNMRRQSGFGGAFLRVAGFAGDRPQIPKVVKMLLIDDQAALRAQLLQWSELASLKRILVSHGLPIEEEPRQALRELANSLV